MRIHARKRWPQECVLERVCAGDVLLHTVTDAVLGALCLPDIGEQWCAEAEAHPCVP